MPEAVRGAVRRSGALVHVGVVRAGGPSLERDDDDPWSGVVRASGGLVWRGTATDDSTWAAEMRAVYEEWGRPIRFDHLRVSSPGVTRSGYPHRLAEGEAFEELEVDGPGIGWLEITAERWATSFTRVITPDETEGHLRAAIAPSYGMLDQEQIAVLARHGHAVSSVTSFVDAESGRRPEVDELTRRSTRLSVSRCSFGRRGPESPAASSPRAPSFDRLAYLRDRLRKALDTCGGPNLRQRAMHGEAGVLWRRTRAAGGDAAAQGPHPRGGHRLGGALRQDPERRRPPH
jgi:hypothetical protein